jgi:hypothetical protein
LERLAKVEEDFTEWAKLEDTIRQNLARLGYAVKGEKVP